MKNTHYNAKLAAKASRRGGILLRRLAFCLFLAVSVAGTQATVLINDTFSDGDRLSQNLPNSAHWFAGGASSSVSVTNQALTSTSANSGVIAYFNATTLSVGASLSLSFNYSFSTTSSIENSFMFGLYDSTGSQVAKDGVNFNAVTFRNYLGYATSGIFGIDHSGIGLDHIVSRDINNKNLLDMASYTEGNSTVQSGAATPGQTYTASMQIARTATGVTVKSQIGDTTMIQTYTSEMFTTFDTVGIFSNGSVGSFTLDNIHLDYTGAPEPSSVFGIMFLGIMVGGKWILRFLKKSFLRSAHLIQDILRRSKPVSWQGSHV